MYFWTILLFAAGLFVKNCKSDSTGSFGATGDTGPPGPIGPAGPPGPLGERGYPGARGVAGQPGSPGLQGYPGGPGLPGERGFPGPQGKDGVVGNAGPAGTPGSPGERGQAGSRGYPGPPGPAGPRGVAGPLGATGVSGRPGKEGRPGERGARGEPGSRGPSGPSGLDGSTGPPGQPGNPGGPRGQPGVPGSPGHRGFTGIMGSTGATGQRGQPGEPATLPPQVLAFINSVDEDKYTIGKTATSGGVCSCSEPSWLIYVALGLGGLSLLLVIILIIVLAKTRRQVSKLHAAIKQRKDGYEYALPIAPLPPPSRTFVKGLRPLKSNSSDDSGVTSDPGETCTDDTESTPSTVGQVSAAEPARQNTYVQETRGSYEQLSLNRARDSAYLSVSNKIDTGYEQMNSRRDSAHKYEQVDGRKKYSVLNDDTISQASSHAYEFLPGMSSQPASRAGSLRTRGILPMAIAEGSEENAV